MSDAIEQQIERILGRMSKVLISTALALIVGVVGAAMFVTRLDMRMSTIESALPRLTDGVDRLTLLISSVQYVDGEINELHAEDVNLQQGINRLEARVLDLEGHH